MATNRTGTLTKGYLENKSARSILRFQYNPIQFNDEISVEYRAIKSPGISYPIYQYLGGDVRTISFTLFLDELEGGNKLRETINFLNGLLPVANKGRQFTAPSEALFAFGRTFVKDVILVAMPTRYTMFDRNLKPIRAEVDVSLQVIQ